MKKFISLALALMLVMSLSVTAFAAETNPDTITSADGTKTINVKGTYKVDGTVDSISVNVAWSGMEFTYSTGSQGTWDPVEHTYSGGTGAGWSTNKGTITVTNNSNVAVTAKLSFKVNEDLRYLVAGTFTETSGTANDNVLELATAVGTAKGEGPSATAEFGISGEAIAQNYETLGTITVTIAKKN